MIGVVGAAFGTLLLTYAVFDGFAKRKPDEIISYANRAFGERVPNPEAGELLPGQIDPLMVGLGAAVIVASVVWLVLWVTRRR